MGYSAADLFNNEKISTLAKILPKFFCLFYMKILGIYKIIKEG